MCHRYDSKMDSGSSSLTVDGGRESVEGWAGRELWEQELRFLFKSPLENDAWMGSAALIAMVPREIALRQGDSKRQLEETFRRALDYADSHESERGLPSDHQAARSRRASRHGARGTFQLVPPGRSPTSPLTDRETQLTYFGDSTKHLGNVRRLAGLWWADELDKPGDRTPRTLAVWGSSKGHLDAFCEQLIEDLKSYLQPSSASTSSPADEDSELRAYALAVAGVLDTASPGFPERLTPTALTPLLTLSPLHPAGSRSLAPDSGLYGAEGTRGGDPARTVLSSVDRAVVLGDPGGGKSTVLADAVIDSVRNGGQFAVVWCRLADLALHLTTVHELPESVSEILELLAGTGRISLGIYTRPNMDALVSALRGPDGGIIALDGLDEVPVDKRDLVEALIRRLDMVGARILVTSRRTGYRSFLQGWSEYSLDRLERKASQRFLAEWFRGVDDPAPLARARAAALSSRGAPLGEVPVLLGIVARVAMDGDVPADVGQLYARYLDLFLQQQWRPPSSTSHRDDNLHHRVELIQRLAWLMALGGSHSVVGATWSDVATLFDLNENAVGAEVDLIDQIVSRDGLLVPHGLHHYRLAQPFRWIHRTIHEYLVGAHLAALFRRNREVWGEHFEAILQSPVVWKVPTAFMASILAARADSVREVFAFAERVRHEGDPGGVVNASIWNLIASLPQDSEHRIRAARACVATGDHDRARTLHQPTWQSEFLVALKSEDTEEVVTTLNGLRALSSGMFGQFREVMLDAMIDALGRIARRGTAMPYGSMVDIGHWRPDDQLRLYAEFLHCGSTVVLPPHYGIGDFSDTAVGDSLARVTEADEHSRTTLLRHILFAGAWAAANDGDHDWIGDNPAYRSLHHVHEGAVLDHGEFAAARHEVVLQGYFGDFYAYDYARAGGYEISEESTNLTSSILPWVTVGLRLGDLYSHTLSLYDARERAIWPAVSSEQIVSPSSNCRFTNPSEIVDVATIVMQWNPGADSTATACLLALYSQLLDREPGNGAGAGEMTDYALGFLVQELGVVLGSGGAKVARELIASSDIHWSRAPSDDFFGLLIESGVSQPEFLDLVIWGLAQGIDVLAACSSPPGRASEWLDLAATRGISISDLPTRGRNRLAAWLAEEGVLPRWRDELIEASNLSGSA